MFCNDLLISTAVTQTNSIARQNVCHGIRVIDPAGFLSVTSNVRNETITNSMFPNMRLKDAICDKLVAKNGKRPDAGSSTEGMVVNLHWVDNKARIYLNMTGQETLRPRVSKNAVYGADARNNRRRCLDGNEIRRDKSPACCTNVRERYDCN